MGFFSLYLVCGLCALASYMVCGIPFGLLIANRLNGVDVRTHGSGNIGMTNVARTAGGKAAALTFACDVGKGTLCMVVGRSIVAALCLGGQTALLAHDGRYAWVSTVLYFACVMGHVFSPYLRFHGGKGISVGLGASLGLYWPVGLGAFAVFLAIVIPTRLISLGSVAAAVALPLFAAFTGTLGIALVPVVAVSAVVVWSHRENIGRLLRGKESRFSIRHTE